MKLNYLYTFMILCFSGVLSGVINSNTRLNKRMRYLPVPNPSDYKLSYGKSHQKLYLLNLGENHILQGGICLYRPERCGRDANFNIKLDYDTTCHYGNSKIKRIAVHDSEGDPVSEIINISKIGQDKFANRYITFYFENGCKFTATYNYKNTEADEEFLRRIDV